MQGRPVPIFFVCPNWAMVAMSESTDVWGDDGTARWRVSLPTSVIAKVAGEQAGEHAGDAECVAAGCGSFQIAHGLGRQTRPFEALFGRALEKEQCQRQPRVAFLEASWSVEVSERHRALVHIALRVRCQTSPIGRRRGTRPSQAPALRQPE